MHYETSYKGDNSPRRAIRDWVEWLGFKNAHILAKVAAGRDSRVPQDLERRWKAFCFYCAFAGVSGYPVREAFKHFAGITQAELEAIPD